MMTDQGELDMYAEEENEVSSGDHDQLPSVEEYKAATGHRNKPSLRRPDPFGTRGKDADRRALRGSTISVTQEGDTGDGASEDDGHVDVLVEEETNTAGYGRKYSNVTTSRSWGVACGICVVTVVIIIVALVVGTNNKDIAPWRISRSRVMEVKEYLIANAISSRSDLERRGSPQFKAAEWIADLDKYQVALPNRMHAHHSFVERYVLAVLFYATGGETNWKHPLNFLTPNHVCTWYQDFELSSPSYLQTEDYLTLGVHGCKLVDGELVPYGLYLAHNDLTGELPDEIGQLSRLEILIIQYNPNLHGTIPNGLKSLARSNNIRKLALQACNFTGTIPSWLGSEFASSLEYLGLGNNQLTGEIPSNIGELTQLKVLALDDNDLSANIEMFHTLPNLISLLLEDNRITGTLSDALLSSWNELSFLDLSNNMITGILPDGLLKHKNNLRVLDLHGNEITGQLSDAMIPSNNDVLEFVALHENRLTGTIPGSISKLVNLKHLDLSTNGFTGTLPTSLADMNKLGYLFTSSNHGLEPGRMPNFLQSLTNLRELGMKGNSLTGQFPNWIHFLSNLRHLDLHNNKLTGTIPELIGYLSDLEHLLLNRNELSGTLPGELDHLTKLEVLLLDKNNIVGDANVICQTSNRGNGESELDTFVSDCSSELDCSCCTLCCDDKDVTCNAYDWKGNLDPIWEYQYQRGRDAFDQGPYVYVVP